MCVGHQDKDGHEPAEMHRRSMIPGVAAYLCEAGRRWWGSVLLVVVTFLVYWPCLRGEFVWDDDAWTVKLVGVLGNVAGLWQIWGQLTLLQQYYPLTATSFWLDYQLWGFWTAPYHVENVLLHLGAALLFWRLLRRLEVPGAGVAASIFALHPLSVESVAWITERKNVLSLVLFLAALHSYGRFTGFWKPPATTADTAAHHNRRAFAWALVLFLLAYLAKATVFAFPAVVLLIAWWKQGRIRWRQDLLPLMPFFMVSFGLGLVTTWLERNHLGAQGPEWNFSLAERCLIAGRALWFYVGKLLWPFDLCFVYPRWEVNAGAFVQWLYPLTAAGVLVGLWRLRRRIGRGPVAAALYFTGSLMPLLGFLNCYFTRYSFVSDHWCYLPSLGLIALGVALVARSVSPGPPVLVLRSGAVVLLAGLSVLTSRECWKFTDSKTLYGTTLARNPQADWGHNNLGLLLLREGRVDEAIAHFEQAIQIRPGSAAAHNNLASALRVQGSYNEAVAQYEVAVQLEPDNANAVNNLAMLMASAAEPSVRNSRRALELAQRANQLTQKRNPLVLGTLAAAYAENGDFAQAVSFGRQAVSLAAQHPNPGLARVLQLELNCYEAGVPFRDAPPVAGPKQP